MRYFHGYVKVDNHQSVRVALRVDYNRCWIGTEAIILGELGQVSQHRQGRGRPCGGSLPHYGDQYRCDVPNAGQLSRLFRMRVAAGETLPGFPGIPLKSGTK